MKFPSFLFKAFLLVTTAIAAPLTSHRQARHEARRLAQAQGGVVTRQSRPPYQLGSTESLCLNASVHPQYSSNWAGAVLIGTGYHAVTAEFAVPSPHIPAGGSSNTLYCASAWVGIDGDTCTSAILQTGIDFCVLGSMTMHSAWYEWYPDYAHDFTGIKIAPGDVIRATVNASSLTSGTAIVENLSNGGSATHTFPGGVGGNLCEYNAEWIVEDYELNGSLVPFVDFGTVTFVAAEAATGDSIVGPSGAILIDISQKGQVLTSSSVGDNSVTVQHV
ncbi:hypothetical protein N7492_001662 [Penicillium capsulatum]|uniref:Aspergillopepsin-2 n=1 Tax=Penicillium capsulatum TaxID=69766 RepID=A0A9W9LZM3_9EURO|nr:hypothetical protein N7492_001662 [Penicillium capsulatum]KAJ6129285.1 hypothetical protein N7512_002065 [Penicillium capsulatum]